MNGFNGWNGVGSIDHLPERIAKPLPSLPLFLSSPSREAASFSTPRNDTLYLPLCFDQFL